MACLVFMFIMIYLQMLSKSCNAPQVLFWLTEATADRKQSRLKGIAQTLLQKPCTLANMTQIAQLSIQAAKLTDTEKIR